METSNIYSAIIKLIDNTFEICNMESTMAKSITLENENINPYTGKPYRDVPPAVELTDSDWDEIRAILGDDDPMQSALDKIQSNYFRDHEGRPGQRGGSLPRGAAGGVDVTEFALDRAFSQGGVTIKATGLPNEPTKGYVVALHPELGQVIENVKNKPIDETLDLLEGYIDKHMDVLSEDGMHLGLWLNSEDGALYMDISSVFQDKEIAIQSGIDADQIAIWDIENKTEIATGGSGRKGLEAITNMAKGKGQTAGVLVSGKTLKDKKARRQALRTALEKLLGTKPAEDKKPDPDKK